MREISGEIQRQNEGVDRESKKEIFEHLFWLDKKTRLQLTMREVNDAKKKQGKLGIPIRLEVRDDAGNIVLDMSRLAEHLENAPYSTFHVHNVQFYLRKEKDQCREPYYDAYGGVRGVAVGVGEISIRRNALRDPRDIFIVLHELGHLEVVKQGDLREFFRQATAVQDFLNTQDTGIQRYALDIMVQNERDAWAAAIRLARSIKKEYGIDVFRVFQDPKDIMIWLRATGLHSYEKARERLGGPPLSKEPQIREALKDDSELQKISTSLGIYVAVGK